MLMRIEPIQYADKPILKVLDETGLEQVTAYMLIRKPRDESSADRYPVLRDRSKELAPALEGLAGHKIQATVTKTGREMAELGFDIVGAAYTFTYEIQFA